MIHTRVAGIPCRAIVSWSPPHPGPAQHCDSDLDYYGYSEIELFDRNGRPAPWLERKLTDADRVRLIQETKQWDDTP